MSARSPTTKRILKEAAELAGSPSPDYQASPLESDLHEWHFTLRGPPAPSPYAGGFYHGRIILPPAYPLKPPSFRFLTPSGRFEVNREICLSISGHHEETWQPAWGIRTALVAIRSFMDSDAGGQVGGMEASEVLRKKLANGSRVWKCGVCRKTNEDIMAEQEAVVEQMGGNGKHGQFPETLRLAYREDLTGSKQPEGSDSRGEKLQTEGQRQSNIPGESAQQPLSIAPTPTQPPLSVTRQPEHSSGRVSTQQQGLRSRRRRTDGIPPWIDRAIYAILGLLIFLLWRRCMS